MNEIQRADTKTRRYFLMGMMLLFLSALILRPIVDNIGVWVAADPELIGQKIPIIVSGITLAFMPLLFMGIYCWQLGRSVIHSGQFPSPGMKVLVDTPIIRGHKALMKGRVLQLVGLLLSASSIAFPIAFWFVLDRVTSPT